MRPRRLAILVSASTPDERSLSLCLGLDSLRTDARQLPACFVLDLASGAFRPRAPTPHEVLGIAEPPATSAEAAGTRVQVCHAGTCRELTVPELPPIDDTGRAPGRARRAGSPIRAPASASARSAAGSTRRSSIPSWSRATCGRSTTPTSRARSIASRSRTSRPAGSSTASSGPRPARTAAATTSAAASRMIHAGDGVALLATGRNAGDLTLLDARGTTVARHRIPICKP